MTTKLFENGCCVDCGEPDCCLAEAYPRLKNETDYLRAALRDALMALTALEARGPDQKLLVEDARERAIYALKWTDR